jgi:SAM-dependent methyltransferase
VVLDIGAGDGHYFREILAGPRIGDALYVATDISIAALRLNRQLNSHRRAAYIVCSADDLPFRCQSVDAAFLFGILHHSRGQSASLNGVVDLVKDNGLLLLHEGVFRQTFSEFVPALSNRNNESAHEHRLDRKELAEALRSSELEILSYEEYSTVVFGASMKILGRLVVKWRPLFSLISFLDRLLARTLGRVMKLFAGGEVLALLRVNRAGD